MPPPLSSLYFDVSKIRISIDISIVLLSVPSWPNCLQVFPSESGILKRQRVIPSVSLPIQWYLDHSDCLSVSLITLISRHRRPISSGKSSMQISVFAHSLQEWKRERERGGRDEEGKEWNRKCSLFLLDFDCWGNRFLNPSPFRIVSSCEMYTEEEVLYPFQSWEWCDPSSPLLYANDRPFLSLS